MTEKLFIFVNGELPNKEIINCYLDLATPTLATDGAANQLEKLNIVPDKIIGDLDSINNELKEKFSDKIIDRPSQYATDLEKALDYALEEDYSEVLLTGINGKYYDHAFTNLTILAKYSDRLTLKFFDNYGDWEIIDSQRQLEISFEIAKEKIVSLLPLPLAKGITTKGLQYPLTNEDLEFAIREGIRNFASNGEVSISLTEGRLAVFKER